jgi:hypothetical protein
MDILYNLQVVKQEKFAPGDKDSCSAKTRALPYINEEQSEK